MPWYRNGHSVPVVYKASRWWVDWSFDEDQSGFDTWREAVDFALTTLHPHPSDPEPTAHDGFDHCPSCQAAHQQKEAEK